MRVRGFGTKPSAHPHWTCWPAAGPAPAFRARAGAASHQGKPWRPVPVDPHRTRRDRHHHRHTPTPSTDHHQGQQRTAPRGTPPGATQGDRVRDAGGTPGFTWEAAHQGEGGLEKVGREERKAMPPAGHPQGSSRGQAAVPKVVAGQLGSSPRTPPGGLPDAGQHVKTKSVS